MPKQPKETNESTKKSAGQPNATDRIEKKSKMHQKSVKEKPKKKKILQQAATKFPEIEDLSFTKKVRLRSSRSYTSNSGLSISDPIEIEDDENGIFNTSDEIESTSIPVIVSMTSDEEDIMEDDENKILNTSDEIKSTSIPTMASIASYAEDNTEDDEDKYDNEGHYSIIDDLVNIQSYEDKEDQNDQVDSSSTQWTEKDKMLVKERRKVATKMTEVLTEISENGDSIKVIFQKKSHQAGIYAPKEKERVSVNINMPKERLLVRHLATTLLAYNPTGMVEVQAAIDYTNEKIYVASNKNEKKLTELLKSLLPGNNKQLSNLNVPTLDQVVKNKIFSEIEKQILELGPSGDQNKLQELKRELYQELKTKKQTTTVTDRLHKIDRIWRHMEQLRQERNGVFGAFTIEQISGSNEQHAETKIIAKKGIDCIDYIGGTRRPCACCFIYMILKGLPQEAYNQHNGALWNSIGAWMSLAGFNINTETSQELLEVVNRMSDKHFINKGAEGKEIYDFDTQSQEYKFA
ncbi:hypothetical protein Aasi_0969 [Candidatus Amoebophilus asiaticus 5a2]|uniref:Uncharacterized protein n=1 Tax=Amoebophilus asiaticus (strain 5a2) TaxID=452471 RepID=B3ESX5_AMOA5|nr:hypothetical protein [Candidatus Amoebophilus asiaticus]ACE06327.1 hypothetical protein Aasi_0969 [Candidatus Amoebophilus asiaticus 5a2]